MKIVVIGGTGLIGSKLVEKLRSDGHQPLAASPEGLAEAVEGAQVVVDVANAPARKLFTAETSAGVGHHVALSVVGADGLSASGYLRAKAAQEETVKAGPVPYTILRATQLFEHIGRVGGSSTLVQPVAADDVARALADVATGSPLNDTVELAGPEAFRLDDLARPVVPASADSDRSLIPGDDARIASTRFEDWLGRPVLTTTPTRRSRNVSHHR
jgi:uncharacterized protein YbjT (DUF2867 family)